MSWIQNVFTQMGYAVLFVPETATELITGGVAPWTCGSNGEYQKCQMMLQLDKEKVFVQAAETMNDKVLIVCDRGALDNKAYMNDLEFAEVLDFLGTDEIALRDNYDAVFHLVTAAKGAAEYYTAANNSARTETIDEAAAIDDKVKTALGDFHTDVDAATAHMRSHLDEEATNIQASIKKQREAVASLKNNLTRLASDVEQCQTQIIGNNNRINSLKGRIENISARIRELDNEIAKLRAKKQQLMSQGQSNGSLENNNSAQLNNIENTIQEYEKQKRKLNEEISDLRRQESSLNEQNAVLRSNKMKLDAAFEKTKNEHEFAKSKCERMESAGHAAQSGIVALSGTIQQYRQRSLDSSSTYTSGIDKCIAAIDEYEAVNLSNGGSGG